MKKYQVSMVQTYAEALHEKVGLLGSSWRGTTVLPDKKYGSP